MIINQFCNVFAISICCLIFACATTNKTQDQAVVETIAASPSGQFKQFSAAHYYLSNWKNLPGWNVESFEQSWPAWQKSCQYFNKTKDSDWQQVCRESQKINPNDKKSIKDFF